MKKAMMMAMVGVLGASVAGAQTWKDDNGQYTLTSCYGVDAGVQCDLIYTLTKKQQLNFDFYPSNGMATLSDGTQAEPRISTGGDQEFHGYGQSVKSQNNVPVKVSLLFNVPNNIGSIRALTIGKVKVDNVRVRPLGSPAPAPVTNSAPAPAPAQAINISGNWNATLTNCRQSAPGVVVCTATLKK